MAGPTPPPAAPATPLDLRLSAIRYGADGTNFYEFSAPDGAALPPFTAGAHVDLHLPNGMVRQYSIASAQEEGHHYLLGIKRDAAGRGGSVFAHDQLKVGQILPVSRPRNHFPLVETGAPIVLIAGGIGVTPLFSMLGRARRLGIACGFYYACRTRAEAALLPDIEALGAVAFHADDEQDGRPLALPPIVAAADRAAHLYCCGPGPMLDAFEVAAAAGGFPAGQVHVERFAAAPPPPSLHGFVVELARSGMELTIGPGETILECARLAGVRVEASCEQGICGSCEVKVLGGVPEHHDMILTDAERQAGKTMMICCSGSVTDRLILDL